jgi:WD40 repeat protein
MHTRFALVLALLGLATVSQAQTTPEWLKGHKDIVNNAAFSSDGKVLATASSDNTVKLWEFPSGKVLFTLGVGDKDKDKDKVGHTKPVYCVAFSKDDKYLATGSQDTTIKLWNPKDGKFIREIKGHSDTVHGLAFSPDGKVLASCGANKDKSVRLWNPDDGKEIKKLGDHKGSVYSVAFSPDGKYLASCGLGDDKTESEIKIWDVKAQKEHKVLKVDKAKESLASKAGILDVVFTPDGKKVISAGYDKVLRVWNVEDGKELKKIDPWDKKKTQTIYSLDISKDGKKAVAAGYGGNLYVWELESGKELFKVEQQGRITYCVVFTPDGSALVTCHEKSTDKKDKGGVAKVTPMKAGSK